MQRVRKRLWLYVTVAVLTAVVLVSLCHQFGYLPHKQNGGSPQKTVDPAVAPVGEQNETSPQPTADSGTSPVVASSGPPIWATLSFSNASGFVTTVHPTNGTIEYVLHPNSAGEFTVTYTGLRENNLTMPIFNPVEQPVDAMNVNLSNGTLGNGSGLSVTVSNATWVTYYQVAVTYTVTSAGSNGLYVLSLPDTFLNTIVDVGTQPYTGPLTWLNGVFY